MNRVFGLCFIGMGFKLTVMRLYFCLVHPLLRASGKDKTMKTPIEFDYDLWTTEEGKCMVRVKLTGEVCEVSRETMRVLRNEEKKLRRSKTGVPIAGCENEDETATLLSLDFVSVQDAEEMSPAWLEDPNDLEETVLTSVMEQEFRLLLSERQLEVYHYCLLGGMSMTDYSKARGIDVSTVFEAKRDVQKKAKIFFKETPKN